MNNAQEDKIKHVINALENPEYEWRTLSGVSEETQLSPDEVTEILNKLILSKKVIQSSDEEGSLWYTTWDYFFKRNEDRVINALENPEYEWRTLSGVSEETQLSPDEVTKILNKLISSGKVIKSRAKNRDVYTTRDHYSSRKDAEKVFIAQTNQAISQLSEADPKEIQKITVSQTVLLREYYLLALEQAKQSFRWALIAAIVGLLFFLGAIAFLLTIQSQSIAVVNVICGVTVEGISGLNFYLYGQTTKQLAHYHQQLDQTQRLLLANSVCESLEGESKQKARLDIISRIATFDVEQSHIFIPKEQRGGQQ